MSEPNLVELVHQHLIKANQDESVARREKREAGDIRYYPSSLGRCIRSNVYQMLGYIGKPHDGQTLLIFENGNSFHTRMEDLFEKMGIMIAPELSLKNPEIYVSGRSDALIHPLEKQEPSGETVTLYDPDGNLVFEGDAHDAEIVEFKSINTKKFDKLPQKLPDSKHMRQLQLYFYQTGLRYGYVYYEDKDNQRQKQYRVARDQKIIDSVIEEILTTVEYVKKKELPDRPFVATDIPCRFCNFRDMCHPNSNPFSYEDLFREAEELPF